MCPQPNVSISIELQQLQQLQLDADGRNERTEWLLNSPEPPSFCNELMNSVSETVLPQKNIFFPSNSKQCKAGVFSFLQGLFPILSWGRNYKPNMFKHDLLAGLTLASLCIPQSIGYANLANLEPQYGLCEFPKQVVVPPLIYAVMGSSRELAIGPVAVVSLLLSAMVTEIVDPAVDPIAYTSLVFTVTFFAGTFQAAFGLLRLGFLVDFLSHAAIVGFMGGAAIIIGLQQLKSLIGISHFTNKTDVVSVLRAVFRSFHDEALSPMNFILGCSFLIFILATRFIGKRNKKLFWLPAIAPLLSVIVATLMVYLTKADQHGVKIVKHFKGGLNPSSAHQLQFNGPHLGQVVKIGLICGLVALTEAIAVGRSFATMKGYHLDGNKEMVAMGFMNIVGSLTSCYTATGSFSRTAVNFSAGCETVVSNIVMAITVFISLELLTKLLYYTPLAILASVILSALPGLIDINEAYHIWKVDKMDFIVCIGAFFGVLFVSVEIGLLIAVGISFARIILDTIRASTEVQGRLPGTPDTFCDITQYPRATSTSGILIIRINSGSLCFANSTSIRERVMKLVTHTNGNEDNTKENVHFVVLDMSNVMSVDTSGIVMLEELHSELVSQSIQLTIANPRLRVINKMKTAKCFDKLGKGWIFLTIGDAVDACLSLKIADLSSTNC
ncbi:hypothetical protein H5410_063050 [Solanum commersonii]|uniref:STAS domain-containing protein n=1 Tax=Solanum commersonii TaxID=4109 RepID=A0A9J5WDB2_SOLCO|nr:hypothetical protein H5410_063050 [Solanum commersonii]